MQAESGVLIMVIDLYTVTADRRCLDKITGATRITGNDGLNCRPTDKVSILNPEFEVDYSAAYMQANYCYCRDFDTYYFISNPRLNTAQRIVLPCNIDVRQTASNAILATPATIVRAESKGHPTQINDSKLPVNPSEKIVTSIVLNETSGLLTTDGNYSYILTVIGGQPTI